MSPLLSPSDLVERLNQQPRFSFAQLPTPLHQLKNFGALLDGPQVWMKRDDLSGLEGGGNKTRKLEFLVGDALAQGCDMLVTVGAIQSPYPPDRRRRRKGWHEMRTASLRLDRGRRPQLSPDRQHSSQ